MADGELTREEQQMHREQLRSNGKRAGKSVKRASSADWRTENLHSLWQRTGTIQFDDAPYPLHEFLRYCLLLQALRRKFEHDDREHQFDACAFFLCGGYFAFKYLNLSSSMRLRGTIFGGLRHAAQPEHEFAKFIAELREKARTAGKQQVELFICEEVKSGTGMGRVMRIIKESMEAASDECAFSVEFYAVRPGTADQMSDHLRSTASKWQGDHKTPTGTLRITVTHFAGSLPTYDSPILRGLDVASTSQDDQEAYEMLKLSDGTLSFWCVQNQSGPVIQIPIQGNCLVEMMSACAVSWTTKSTSILTRTLETAITGRNCQVCKALLQRIVQLMNQKSITYSACHEAGHAFARAANGDTILLIDAIEGSVSFGTADWKCGCGGYLRQQDGGGVVFNFNPDCKDCDVYVIKLLAANYVGATATVMLMPEEHDPRDAECDYAAATEFQAPYKDAPEKWKALKLAAAERAEDLVRISAATILKLRDAIVAAGGRLDGRRAHEIVASQTKTGN